MLWSFSGPNDLLRAFAVGQVVAVPRIIKPEDLAYCYAVEI